MKRRASTVLAQHVAVAQHGLDTVSRGPIEHQHERRVPTWLVIPAVCVGAAVGWHIARIIFDLWGLPQ